MATKVTWLGHATWLIEAGQHRILVDPFLSDSPTAPVKAADVQADFILISHGHHDHVGDAAAIAKRCKATIVSCFEIAEWFARKQGVRDTLGMNLGGGVNLPFGRVQLTLAFHSSTLPDGSSGGSPAGFVLKLADGTLYFACDTGLFGDMRLIGEQGIDVAILPIGDLFTMGPDDALRAVKLIQPRRVVPSHYNTWPPIAQDPHAWAQRVRTETSAEPIVVNPGQSFSLDKAGA